VTTFSLFGQPSPGADGPPAAVTSYAGPFCAGVVFEVTEGNTWLEGFWWWVPDNGDTAAQQFALWQLYNTASTEATDGTTGLVPAATTTSATLAAGQWNLVRLAAPVPLAAGIPYVAATGWQAVHGFPATDGQFASGGAHADGITSGPLHAYSDLGASSPVPNDWANQGLFGLTSTSPTASIPAQGDNSANFWLDVQVSDAPPAGAAYRLWPSLPVPPNMWLDSPDPFTIATEVILADAATADRIWFYTPPAVGSEPAATVVPQEVGIYDQATQALVAGTYRSQPAWSGAAGTGWISCELGGVALPAGSYRVAVCSGPTTTAWNNASVGYFTEFGGTAGVTFGPLTAPGESAADAPGQGSYNAGETLAWPGSYDGVDPAGPCYWIDLEVTPQGENTTATETGTVLLSFFP
jgi:hypothetical protein